MDAGSAQVVATAPGVVVETRDGEYDRCHADLFTGEISCDGYPIRANFVTLEHEGGWRTSYLHLKSGSIIVREGDRVDCGQNARPHRLKWQLKRASLAPSDRG